jgi:hypothetical protein
MRIFLLVTLFVLAESTFLVKNLFRYFKSPEYQALDLGIKKEEGEIANQQRENALIRARCCRNLEGVIFI